MPNTNSASYQIANGLFLVLSTLTGETAKPAAPSGANHFVVIDRSGSMYGVMPRMREQFKSKILGLMKDGDTLTLLVFSSRDQFTTVLEGVSVATLKDLRDVHNRIDRELRATNLTGFKDPLDEVSRLVGRVKSKNPGPCDLWFLSDGYDNQWSRPQILKAMADASKEMAAVTVVEFGDYADRALLAEMATVAGGKHIYAEDFDAYEPVFETAMASTGSGAPKVEVPVEGDPIGGFAFALSGSDLLSSSVVNGHVAVPADLKTFAYLSPSPVGIDERSGLPDRLNPKDPSTMQFLAHAYAALSLFSVRMRSDLVFPILKALGDVKFVKDFSVCFGKQRYSVFMDSTRAAAFGTGRFAQGYDPSAVPPDDCFTIWTLLSILTEEKGAKLLIDRFADGYKKVGRATVNASEKLTKEEAEKVAALQVQIDEITTKTAGAKGTKLLKSAAEEKAKLQAEIDAILASKKDPPKFEADPCPEGIDITGLVFNEEQPNISIQTKRTGKVNIEEAVDAAIADPANAAIVPSLKKLPRVIDSFQFRNYAIVKDGLVNVDELPVTMPRAMWDKLLAAGLSMDAITEIGNLHANGDVTVSFKLRQIPVMNRAMVKAASGRQLFELEYNLCRAKAAQKVYNSLKKEAAGERVSAGFEAAYGAEAAKWLKEGPLGLTDYSGYGPKRVQADPVDFYMGKFLNVLIYEEGALAAIAAGKTAQGKLDSLPTVKEAEEARTKGGKLKGGKALMADVLAEVETQKKALDNDTAFTAWLVEKQEETVKETRRLILEKARLAFVLLVGQVWFTEPEFAVPVEITLKGKKDDKKLLGSTHTFTHAGQKFDFIAGQEERKVLI